MAYTLYAGKTYTILEEASSTADVVWKDVSVSSDAVLVSLWVDECAGDLDLVVYTQDNSGHETVAVTFPTISGPTSEILIRKAATIMSRIRVEASYTAAARFKVSVKGISAGETSVKMAGQSTAVSSQIDIGTTATALFPTSLQDRSGLILKNNSTSGILYIGYTVGEATIGNGYPIGPGSSISIDLAGGQSVYGVASSGTLDIRKMESGG